MPDPAGTKNDGGMQFGSQLTTIGGTEFIAENISVTRPTRIIESNNQYGVPNKQVIVDGKPTGTATLQLPAANTPPPARREEFTLLPVGGGAPVTYITTEVGDAFDQNGETKVNISFVAKLSS